MARRLLLPILLALVSSPAFAQWTQFGGPERNYHAPAGELAASWPETGPPVVWRRVLGDGYSGVLVDGERLYTLERRGGREFAVSLRRDDGKTVWEHGYEVVTHSSAQQFFETPVSDAARAYVNGHLVL